MSPVLLLPSWQNEPSCRWQTRWETEYGDVQVAQHDWTRPLRGDWLMRLDEVIQAQPAPVLLAAHGLACILVAAWATHSHHTHQVIGAMLVDPIDTAVPELRGRLKSWSDVPTARLPFPGVLLPNPASIYCSLERAQKFATWWGAKYIVADLPRSDQPEDKWPEGRALLARLQ